MTTPRKCLVWDLDETLWEGVCLYGDVRVREEVRAVVAALDGRGILQSIASRGEPEVSFAALRGSGLADYFLAPRVNWLPKPTNLLGIARELGIGTDALAFIDDDRFERAQLAAMMPEVLVLDAADAARLPDLPEFRPERPSPDARRRRELYRSELVRREEEARAPSRREFLLSCGMKLAVRPAVPDDRDRILELSTRTHRLNTTGADLGEEEISRCLGGGARSFLVAELEDRFGSYGTVGIALLDPRVADRARIDYLAMSCRVLGRGVETAFLRALLSIARDRGARCAEAPLVDTGRNRAMRSLYQMAGFAGPGEAPGNGPLIFVRPLDDLFPGPEWVEVRCASC